MYRPKDWKNKYLGGYRENKDAFEAGADAMLKALIKQGTHFESGVILDAGVILEVEHSCTVVFIPDDEVSQ